MSLCLSASGVTLALAIETFSLSWVHSVEKIEWREDWRVTEAGLVVESAVVTGSGAGMEVPEGAVLRDGAWHYRPALPPQAEVVFADAGRGAGDWRLCEDGVCRDVGDLVPSRGGLVTFSVCVKPGTKFVEVPSRFSPSHRPSR